MSKSFTIVAADSPQSLSALLEGLTPEQEEQARQFLKQLRASGRWANSRETQEFLAGLDRTVIAVVPEHLMKLHRVIPLELLSETAAIKLGMADPEDVVALDDVQMATGLKVVPAAVAADLIAAALDQFFGTTALQEVAESITNLPIDFEDGQDPPSWVDDVSLLQIREMVDEAPIIRFLNLILSQAVIDGATHIHIDMHGATSQVRFRMDGELSVVMAPPIYIHGPLLSRLKVMANVEIWKKDSFASGRIDLTLDGKRYELVVNFGRSRNGEKAVVKIVDRSSPVISFAELGMSRPSAARFNQLLERNRGLLLVTGPSGSGVSTLMAFCLNRLNSEKSHVLLYADESEVEFGHLAPGINVIVGDRKAARTGPELLDSLRQLDPDVLSLPKLDRSLASGLLAYSAASGLTVSSMDLPHPFAVIPRLIEVGVSPVVLAEGLSGVVTQRLARQLCANCRQSRPSCGTESDCKPGWVSRGCDHCKSRGHRGRIGIHEVLVITPRLRDMIAGGASPLELRQAAPDEGHWSLEQDAALKVEEGLISWDEYRRVTG